MNTNKKTTGIMIDVRIILSALWAARMLSGLQGDVVRFMAPGMLEEFIVGATPVPVTNELLLVMSIIFVVPIFMSFLTLTLKYPANRRTNLTLNIFFVAFDLTFFGLNSFLIEGMSPIATIASVTDTFFTDSNILEGLQYYYAVTTNDQSGYENDHIYVLGPVVDYPFHITTASLDTGIVGETYRDTLGVIGGDPPYNWEITSGTSLQV
jgi:hypothetical protein